VQLRCREDEGVNFAAQAGLFASEQGRDAFERHSIIVGHQHDVDVAGGVVLTSGEGTENESGGDVRGDRLEGGSQSVGDAHGSDDDLLEGVEQGRVGIGAEEAVLFPAQDARAGQLGELALDGAHSAAGAADDFAEVEGLVGTGKREGEDGLARAAEEYRRGVLGCNHFGYNCNRSGYRVKEGELRGFV
jgi:hypothetical protein